MKKIVTFLVAVALMLVLCVSAFADSLTFGDQSIDLSILPLSELKNLKKEVEAEITRNHDPSSSEKDAVLDATKAYVESSFKQRGIEVSWPWFDYDYTQDWEHFTLSTRVDYRADSKSQSDKIYSEVDRSGSQYVLTYLKIGDSVMLDNRGSVPAVTAESASAETAVVAPVPTVAPAPEKKTEFGIGEKATINGVDITLLSVKENKGSSFNRPDSGNVFLLCEFEFVNNSDKDITVSSIASFDAYCDDYSISNSFSAELEGGDGLDGTIAPGKRLKGTIGYEVGTGWKKIEIVYSPSLWSSDTVKFTNATTPKGNSSNTGNTSNAAAAMSAGKKGKIRSGGSVNVRSGPSAESSKVGSVNGDMVVNVLGESNGWYEIQMSDGTTGWVSGKMIKVE